MKEEFKLFPFGPDTKMILRSFPGTLRPENKFRKKSGCINNIPNLQVFCVTIMDD